MSNINKKTKIYKSTPKKLQKETIIKMIESCKEFGFAPGFCEMGTGKSLMSLYVGIYLYQKNIIDTIIIICPKALIDSENWVREIHKHINLDVLGGSLFIWKNNKFTSKKSIYEFNYFLKSKLKIIIVNIEAFSIENKNLNKIINCSAPDKTIIIIDESTKIKNPSANRTKRICKIFENKEYKKIILTGTEITNSILDLYSQFIFLNKNFWCRFGLNNFHQFRARYSILKDKVLSGGRRFKEVVGFQRIQELENRLKLYIIRLRLQEMEDMPEKVYIEEKIKMSKEMYKIYYELKDRLYAEYKDRELTLTSKQGIAIRFRQICSGFFPSKEESGIVNNIYIENDNKLNYIIEDTEDYSKKYIVFSSFVDSIKLLNQKLENVVAFYGGDLTTEDRQRNMNLFINNEATKGIIINPQSGAHGLNLQFCSLTYYYTPPNSVEQFWQSQDRTWRMGQKNKPVYKFLIYENSIEERIYATHNNKKELADAFKSSTLDDFFDLI